jgi:aminoglycoside phosphotransferase
VTVPTGARYLDGDAGIELLAVAAEHAGAELRSAHLRSVHHRPGRSVSNVYAAVLGMGDGDREVLLVAHADRRPLPSGTFELERDGNRVAVWRFPHDPFLPGLASAVDPVRVRELLDELGAPPGEVSLHTRAYRPSRRAVVEVTIRTDDVVGRVLYLKVLAGDRAAELAEVHAALADRLPVPRVVGVSPEQGILALEALEGRTLRAALVEGGSLPDPASILALSRRFADRGLSTRRDPRAFADPTRHVALLRDLAPDLDAEIDRVATAAAALEGPLVGVHGDLHDGQLLLQGDQVTGVLDVDGAGLGLLAQDAGNLIAHVQVVGALWSDVTDRCEDYARGLRDAYVIEVGDRALATGIAGAWLGLATGPHRAQEPGWPASTRHRIQRAIQSLDGET